MTELDQGTIGEHGRDRSVRGEVPEIVSDDSEREFVNEQGDTVTATIEEFNTRLVHEGYRPAGASAFDTEALDTVDEEPHE